MVLEFASDYSSKNNAKSRHRIPNRPTEISEKSKNYLNPTRSEVVQLFFSVFSQAFEPEALADPRRRKSASLDIAYVCYCMSSALAKQSRGRFFSNFAGLAHNAPYPIDARRR